MTQRIRTQRVHLMGSSAAETEQLVMASFMHWHWPAAGRHALAMLSSMLRRL